MDEKSWRCPANLTIFRSMATEIVWYGQKHQKKRGGPWMEPGTRQLYDTIYKFEAWRAEYPLLYTRLRRHQDGAPHTCDLIRTEGKSADGATTHSNINLKIYNHCWLSQNMYEHIQLSQILSRLLTTHADTCWCITSKHLRPVRERSWSDIC